MHRVSSQIIFLLSRSYKSLVINKIQFRLTIQQIHKQRAKGPQNQLSSKSKYSRIFVEFIIAMRVSQPRPQDIYIYHITVKDTTWCHVDITEHVINEIALHGWCSRFFFLTGFLTLVNHAKFCSTNFSYFFLFFLSPPIVLSCSMPKIIQFKPALIGSNTLCLTILLYIYNYRVHHHLYIYTGFIAFC